MLSPRSRRQVGVDALILVVYLYLDLVVDHRIDPHRGEARVAPRVGVKGRDANQPMDTAFGLEPTVGVRSVDTDGRRFDPGFLTAAFLQPFCLVAMGLGP